MRLKKEEYQNTRKSKGNFFIDNNQILKHVILKIDK
ncbi:hypothetical protein ABIE50_003636 [Chitinophaga sp. OAE865]